MLDVTLEQLVDILGGPTKHIGHQYYFRCPVCAQNGGDTNGDNLLFNERKRLLKCFACDSGAQYVLKAINKKNTSININHNTVKKDLPFWWQTNSSNLWQYWIEAYTEMTECAQQWLNNCGIDNDTINEWMIGFDSNPSIVKIGPCVCFPMISLNHNRQLVGFELRQIGKEKIIRHTYDSPKCLCIINDPPKANKLIICEGFKDAYSFLQIIKQKQQYEDFTILTPSHGVNSIIDALKDVDFIQYKKCFLLLDNDEAGSNVTNEIISQYKFFKDVRHLLKQYKDVNELWLNEYV